MQIVEKIGIYPGTFDPITNGHLDVIKRSLYVVDRLIIAVAEDCFKNTLFSLEERKSIAIAELEANNFDFSKVEIVTFSGLLIDFAKKLQAGVIIRGIRVVSDFEYEFQMSCMNSKLAQDIQTIFLPANEKLQLVSSKIVKEVVRLGGNVGDFASVTVQEKIREKFLKNLDKNSNT